MTEGNIETLRKIFKENLAMKVLDEELFLLHNGLLFLPFHFLLKSFNDMILDAVQGGLIDFWRQSTGEKWRKPQSEPVVLTWNHLYVGFYIWLICLATSFVTFVGDFLCYRYKLRQSLKKA